MLHVSPRRAAGALAALLATAGLAAVPARATEDFSLSRIAGDERYATAAGTALEAFAAGAEAVVLARGDDFPDALAGTYLTGALGAPVLLTATNELPQVTSDALDTLGATTVYLLGGTSAISEAVATEVEGEGETARTVERVAGDNRYATAAEIATGQDATSIGEVDGKRAAFLASGISFADALAAGPLAHAARLPIILTPPDSLAPEASAAIDELAIEHLVVVGGTAAVTDATVAAATSGGATSQRVAGGNRYSTATAVADFALAELGFDDTGVDLATGGKFPDALAAGPSSGEANRPLLLTGSTALSPEAKTWLEDHAGTLAEGRVFGGTAAVSDAVVAAAEAAGSGEVTGPSEGQLTFADTDTNTYRYVPDGAETDKTVTYAAGDTFLVDGNSATVGGFETAVTPGDRIRHVPAEGTNAARHELTNVAASSITEGMVGNVDVASEELDIINAVNGDAIRSDLSWADVLFSIDGQDATATNFAGSVNEGDTIEITGAGATTRWELTNEDVFGVANAIGSGGTPIEGTTTFKIDDLGDDPATDADESYVADGADEYNVDGAESDYATFSGDLTAGDAVTHARSGGTESYTLVNRAPSAIEGDAVEGNSTTSGPLPTQAGGGSFTIVTEDGPEDVSYAAGGTYLIDGSVANEEEFEAAYSAGDEVVFRAADTPSGASQRIELTNKTLEGPVGPETVNTADDAGAPGSSAPAPNSYGVLGRDGETVVRQVEYTAGASESSNTYHVNGSAVTLERFEQELEAIKAETRSGNAQVATTGTGEEAVTQHRLTTTGAPITATTTTTAA